MKAFTLIRAGVVVNRVEQEVAPIAAQQSVDLVEDVTSLAVQPSTGWTWQGPLQYTRVVPPEVINQRTIEQQTDAALAANKTALDQLVAWRTTGPGAGTANLTAAQMSQALRTTADNEIAMLRELSQLIRLVRGKFDATD